MSIQAMRQRFAVHLRYVLYVIIGVFTVGLPFMFTPGFRGERQDEQGKTEQDAVATVNGKPLLRGAVDKQFDLALQQVALYEALGQSVGLRQMREFRLQAFEQAIQQQVLQQQAEQQGISAGRSEVKREAEKIADQNLEQLRQQYKGDLLEPALGRIVAMNEKKEQARSMSPGAFRKWAIKRLLEINSDDIKNDLVMQQLRSKVTASVTVAEPEFLASYDKMNTRQILVSLQPQGKPTRTDEQARKRAEELAAKAKGGADFAALAKAESDDAQGRAMGGSQPVTFLSGMSPGIQRALWNLKPGDVSAPVKLPGGYAVVKVESRVRELPRDFEKNKQQLMSSFVERRKLQAFDEYVQGLRQSAKIQVTDPEMLAYQALQTGNEKDAMANLQKAVADAAKLRGLPGSIVYYDLASIYAARGQWKEAADNYGLAADWATQDEKRSMPGARAEALMGLAQASEKLGKPDEALNWYAEASNWADTPGVHSQLILTYQRLGKQDLVKKEQDWLTNYQQQKVAEQQRALEQQKAATQPAQPQPSAQRPVEQKPAAPATTRPAATPSPTKPTATPAPSKPAPAGAATPAPTGR